MNVTKRLFSSGGLSVPAAAWTTMVACAVAPSADAVTTTVVGTVTLEGGV